MKRKNAEEFVRIIQFLMSPDEENWTLGISLLSETSFYKNLNKHSTFSVTRVLKYLGNLQTNWDDRDGPWTIKLKEYVQNLLKNPPKPVYSGVTPSSIGIVGTILFQLLWDDDSGRTRNNPIVRNEFYQIYCLNRPKQHSKHNRNFARRKNRKHIYDQGLHYYEQILNSNVNDYYESKFYNSKLIYSNVDYKNL